eukprot:333640_1
MNKISIMWTILCLILVIESKNGVFFGGFENSGPGEFSTCCDGGLCLNCAVDGWCCQPEADNYCCAAGLSSCDSAATETCCISKEKEKCDIDEDCCGSNTCVAKICEQ